MKTKTDVKNRFVIILAAGAANGFGREIALLTASPDSDGLQS